MTDPKKFYPTARHLAAYLGDSVSREILGSASPEVFSLQSMLRGGDRPWRAAMQLIGHEGVAAAACAVAEIAFTAYCTVPDANDHVHQLATNAVKALEVWRPMKHSQEAASSLWTSATKFFLAVEVDGELHQLCGRPAQAFGRIMGLCCGVIAAPENARSVRSLGVAADYAQRLLNVDEAMLRQRIAAALLPYALTIAHP